MQRPNSVGWGLVLFFLLGGIAFTIAIPEIWLGQIWVVVALGLAALYLVMGRRAAKAEKLRTTGIPATATILQVEQTGMYVNEQPQMRFVLRVDAEGREPFEVEKTSVVPFVALGKLSSGQALPVYLDPEDPDDLVLDWGTIAAPFTISLEDGRTLSVDNPAARQEALKQLQAYGFALEGENDLRQNPTARAAVLDVLRRHGYPVDTPQPAAPAPTPPATPAPAPVPAPVPTGDPVNGLEKLAEMKEKGLISQSEFESQKARILADL